MIVPAGTIFFLLFYVGLSIVAAAVELKRYGPKTVAGVVVRLEATGNEEGLLLFTF